MLLQRSSLLVLLSAATVAFSPSLVHGQGPVIIGSQIALSASGGGYGITGLPYSAQMVTTRVQTLADGTQITHVTKQFQSRDSEGRTRTEIYFPEGEPGSAQNAGQPLMISIFDPVAGQNIDLNPRQKTAIVSPFPAPQSRTQANPVQNTNP